MIDLAPLIGPPDELGVYIAFRVFPKKGRERWLLELRYWRPWHLETWPRANLRAHGIYAAARFLGFAGIHLPFRRVTLSVARGSAYDEFRQSFDKLSVFLGTPGLNQKFVVFAKKGKKAWFIKVPISVRSIALAKTEAAALSALSQDDDLAPLVPQFFWIGKNLAIEDVRLTGGAYAPLDIFEMSRVHDLLFSRSWTEDTIEDIATGWANPGPVPHPDQETRTLIDKARDAAYAHISGFEKKTLVQCYLAHGDFTRWNVLRSKDGSARIIDWELYGKRPKFFDPFHYIVSQAILVDQANAREILERIFQFGSSVADRSSVLLYFSLYLIEQVLTYCDLYERGSDTSPQVHWQLRKWKDLFDLLSSDPMDSQAAGKSYPCVLTKSVP